VIFAHSKEAVMPNFRYKAQDPEGKIVYGNLNASDEQDLHERLKLKKLMFIEAKNLTKKSNYKPLKAKALAEYSRQIGTLISSGIPLVRALQIISEDEAITPYERRVYTEVMQSVMQGNPLSESMESLRGVFPPLILNMFRAAETSGGMDDTALRVSVQYTKEDQLNSKVNNSMTYPKILMGLMVLVVFVIFSYIIPQFDSLFASMPSLPIATVIILAISGFLKKSWYVVVFVVIALFIASYFLKKIPKVIYVIDKIKIKLPKFGKLFKIIYTARFARTFCSLYSSGISVITCLSIARSTIGNSYIDAQFDKVIADTQAGEPLSVALGRVDGFVKKIVSAVKVGEESGSLDTMLTSIANDLEFESERAIDRMVAYIEPLMIIVMAFMVGFIMIAIILPIYQSYQTIGKS